MVMITDQTNKKRPNILFLMCDQLQAEVLKEDSDCLTPHIDRLLSRGLQFERAYTPNAVCSPARASLMTGLLPHNHGVLQVTHTVDDDQCNLREQFPHWAESLVEEGYTTGYFGKWHIERSNNLEKFGWQINGCVHSPLYHEKAAELLKDTPEEIFSVKKYVMEPHGYRRDQLLYGVTNIDPKYRKMGVITSLAADFLGEQIKNKKKPWCCFVSVPEPHDPFICGEAAFEKYDIEKMTLKPNIHDSLVNQPNIYKKAARTWESMSDDERKQAIACYYASITEIDERFGKLLDQLESADILDDTLIILTSDHGELLGAHGLYCKNFSAFEEIYNIPLIISGPRVAKGKTRARVGLHDLAPTITEWIGSNNQLFTYPDSQSFTSVLQDPEKNEQHFLTGFAEYHGGRLLISQRIVWYKEWKYVFNGFDFDELYDLKNDPYELHNLIDEPGLENIVKQMCTLMWEKVIETGDHSLSQSHYPILRVAPFGPLIAEQNE